MAVKFKDRSKSVTTSNRLAVNAEHGLRELIPVRIRELLEDFSSVIALLALQIIDSVGVNDHVDRCRKEISVKAHNEVEETLTRDELVALLPTSTLLYQGNVLFLNVSPINQRKSRKDS